MKPCGVVAHLLDIGDGDALVGGAVDSNRLTAGDVKIPVSDGEIPAADGPGGDNHFVIVLWRAR